MIEESKRALFLDDMDAELEMLLERARQLNARFDEVFNQEPNHPQG